MKTLTLVTSENTTQGIDGMTHVVVAEASTLGLAPGECPWVLPTTLGNGRPFHFYRIDGEVLIYWQEQGCIRLHVLND